MVCKHCQHNNPETNRFCGMCGQALPYPQVKSATTSIPSSSPNQAGTLGLRQSSASVGPIAPLAPKPQTAAPVSSEKKVQFPPVASPPQTSNPAASAQRTSAPATYAPVTSEKRVPPSVPPPTSVAPERRLGPRPPILEDTEKRAFVSPYPVAPRAPVVPEKKAQGPVSLGPQASAPVDDRRVTGGVTDERKAPFPTKERRRSRELHSDRNRQPRRRLKTKEFWDNKRPQRFLTGECQTSRRRTLRFLKRNLQFRLHRENQRRMEGQLRLKK